MRLMRLGAIYQAPRTSAPHPVYRVYPYLLKGLVIERPDHVWYADITYIPVRRGFLYLVAILDWSTRHVLAWRLSNTMDARFCVAAPNEALKRCDRPKIFNADQDGLPGPDPGITSLEFYCVLNDAQIAISMDGRGQCLDRIFIERLWRSLKHVAVYLHEMTDGFAAECVIGAWIALYNIERSHSLLDGRTPAEAYAAGRPVDMMDNAGVSPTSPQAQQPQKAFKTIRGLAA